MRFSSWLFIGAAVSLVCLYIVANELAAKTLIQAYL